MNSTSVSTSCATERCTSSGSAFPRSGDADAPARSSSRRRSSSLSTSVIVSAPRLATTFFLADGLPCRSGLVSAAEAGADLPGRRARVLTFFFVTLPIVRKCIGRPRSADAEPDGALLSGAFDRHEIPAGRGSRHEMIDRHHVAALLDALLLHES